MSGFIDRVLFIIFFGASELDQAGPGGTNLDDLKINRSGTDTAGRSRVENKILLEKRLHLTTAGSWRLNGLYRVYERLSRTFFVLPVFWSRALRRRLLLFLLLAWSRNF